MTVIRFSNMIAAFALVATLAIATPSAFAQAPTTTPAPQHQSIFHKLFGKKQPATATQPGMASHQPYGSARTPYGTGSMGHFGSIIGNKNTHVYHLAGDMGSLPAMKNRVYFTSESQAVAAGFHKAGSGHSTMKTHVSHAMHSTATANH